MIPVRVKKLDPEAQLPTYATADAACFDIRTTHQGRIVAEGSCLFSTGLAFEIPEKHVMLVFSRSGHGFNSGLRLANCVGVIDADYRGELMVKLQSDVYVGSFIAAGDRIAQGLVLPIEQAEFLLVDELGETERGEGGFGSTGAQ